MQVQEIKEKIERRKREYNGRNIFSDKGRIDLLQQTHHAADDNAIESCKRKKAEIGELFDLPDP